jgi:hypothetical protein
MTQHKQAHARITLDRLAARRLIEIAVDTEFHHAHTLTIQVAARPSARRVVVQVYRSLAIPPPPDGLDLAAYLPTDSDGYGRFFDKLAARRAKAITPDLSPARMLTDLFRLDGVTPVSRHEGRRLVAAGPPNAVLKPGRTTLSVPTIRIVLVGHFLPADFARCFGRDFYDDLFDSRPDGERPLAFAGGKVVGLAYPGGSAYAGAPVVEFASTPDGSLYEVRLETRDTNQPFGTATLDRLSRTFLGLPKPDALDEGDKQDMLRAFREKTAKAYGYAIADAVNTLLVHEQMLERDREIYSSFGVADGEIPSMKATLGSRVVQFLSLMSRESAAGSEVLKTDRALRRLMRKGGRATFGGERAASRFGFQAGQVHGGLNFSRSPTRFWHEAEGMLRDVDMSGCYTSIISGIDVYWGRPVVHEPGNRAITLLQAVRLLADCCDPDAWYIRVTGDIREGHNTLIPSTAGAITSANYRRMKPQGPDPEGARLFSGRIESGVVTHATWRMIRAMPPALRGEYERLSAESLVFYPRKLVAGGGAEYDRLLSSLGQEPLPWGGTLDLDVLTKTAVEPLDADYISLRFRIGGLARSMAESRRRAKLERGKGSGMDLAWKHQANTMYGVLAGRHFATGNAVAGNVITSSGRAGAFALINALNGIQVITDGCTYRRDQVPACTFAECLELQPDYSLRRAEAGGPIPFIDPADVPVDDGEFTTWYRSHARRFFGVDEAAPGETFGLHDLEHKATPNRPSFDALACDGGNFYLKCSRSPDGSWDVHDMSMRGHGPSSKEGLKGWILETYPADRMESLPPITQDRVFLKAGEAKERARRCLKGGVAAVVMPLGHHDRKVLSYQAIRLSAFVCRDPKQWKALKRQFERLEHATGCGLEVLALRRGYRDRPARSLVAIASEIYDRIRAGERDLCKGMHLTRPSRAVEEATAGRRAEVERLRDEAWADLFDRIACESRDPDSLTAAVLCTNPEAPWLD